MPTGSDENPGVEGLGLIPSRVSRFTVDRTHKLAVPEIGWNGVNVRKTTAVFGSECREKYYFVHSFLALPNDENKDWILATTNYGPCEFISIVQHGNVLATQFHPEKSGRAGLALFEKFLNIASLPAAINLAPPPANPAPTKLAPRVIACLDVRANDAGDLVVTKGDQYDVREKAGKNDVRNLGKPVELAARYYIDGADEITFLNITSFRSLPLQDQPMLEVLRQTSERVFVPLTIGYCLATPAFVCEQLAYVLFSPRPLILSACSFVMVCLWIAGAGSKTQKMRMEPRQVPWRLPASTFDPAPIKSPSARMLF